MPTSVSTTALLSAIALAIAGASILAVAVIVIAVMAFEVYIAGSSDGGTR